MQDFFRSRKEERAKEQQLLEQQLSDLREGVDRTGFSLCPSPSTTACLTNYQMSQETPTKQSLSPSSIGASAVYEEVFKSSCVCPFLAVGKEFEEGHGTLMRSLNYMSPKVNDMSLTVLSPLSSES